MKIQIFVQSLSVGGAERVASMWANGFLAEGHEVSIVLFQPLDFPRTYEIDSRIKIWSVYSKKKGKIRNFIDRFRKTARYIKCFVPNYILTVYHVQDIPIWFYTRGTQIKIISTEHNSFERPPYAPMSKRDYFLKFYVNRLFDAVTVLTQADADFIGNRLKRVFIMPNPLAFSPITEQSHRKKIIMAVGRLDVWLTKGFDLLIKAFAQLLPEYPDWRLRIVGSANDKGESKVFLQNLVNELGICKSVDFLEYRKDIKPLYRECEIFVLSSRYEGFGLVLLEAMSQGCVCVACDYKGRQKEIIGNREYGLWCPSNDIGRLKDTLCQALRDDYIREILHQKAPERVSSFSLHNIMIKWSNIFSKI